MIHTARSTGKFIKLVRWLRRELKNCPVDHETIAVGILERMWHFTIASHKRGDIGSSSDEVIAEVIGWNGDESEIIECLIDCKWLVRSDEFRLVVNDWAEHAPAFIKRNAKKVGGLICVKSPLKPPSDTLSDHLTHPEGVQVPTLNVTQPNATKPNQTKPNSTQGEESSRGSSVIGKAKLPQSLDTEDFRDVWSKWQAWCQLTTGMQFNEIKAEFDLSELANRGHDKAIADLKLTMQKANKVGTIWDSDRGKPGNNGADEQRSSIREAIRKGMAAQ